MSTFQYSKDKLNKLIQSYNLTPATMYGVKADLKRLKSIIEKIYDEDIFYLSHWKSECPYHGWSWSDDNNALTDMATVTDGITEKFLEIYALILAGLGETVN